MIPLWKSFGFAVALVVAHGCFGERIAGNSSETENTATARLVFVDSLLRDWNRLEHSPTVATLRLDSSHFDFSTLDSSGEQLSIERPDGSSMPFEQLYWDRTAKQARLRVRIDPALQKPGGWFRLRWGPGLEGLHDPIAVWDSIPAAKRVYLTSIVVDDFESGNGVSLLPELSGWYSGASDSATVSKPQFSAASHGRSGLAAGITYSANRNAGRYSLIGLKLGTKARNLRSLDSVVAWVRGSGSLAVALERPDSLKGTKAWAKFTLDTAWKRIRIRPTDFDPPDGIGGNIGWIKIRDSITRISFIVSGGSELWVDDLRLHGVDPDDFR
ncbi:MAG: hypothetical protein IPK50_08355 [Fibrobacterota bacterium]|nr:MAG: hypothetical protein IPK50_08355 [Fibrobacterota bacterium]